MATVYLASDYHLGHKNIGKYRDTCTNEEENYEFLKERWHKLVTKRDLVICLGDMCFTEERLKDFQSWTAAKKILICGNHDTDNVSMKTIAQHYDEVYSLYKYKGMWLSHAPIHPKELRGKVNVHGHMHYETIEDDRYLNVCPEQTEGLPVNIEIIRQLFNNRGIILP